MLRRLVALAFAASAGCSSTTEPVPTEAEALATSRTQGAAPDAPFVAAPIASDARPPEANVRTAAASFVTSAASPSFQNEVMVTDLDVPTNIEFLPNGAMLIGELTGQIHYVPAGATRPSATDFMRITDIGSQPQGLMDMILDPSFATNGWIYVSYTHGNPHRDRVSRFTATGATASLASETTIWQDVNTASDEHHGLALAFDSASPPHLFITTGEHFEANPAQDLTSELGKVLRVNRDGSVPLDNPFNDGAGPHADRVYALGMRNPFRAFFDAPTGRLFVGDVGGNDPPTSMEEVNLITAGANYAWPLCEGNCGEPGYAQPFYTYSRVNRDASITGGIVYHGTAFPAEYRGNYFFGDFAQNWIKRLVLNTDGSLQSAQNFMPTNGEPDTLAVGSVVHLVEGPDGALWYTSIGAVDGEEQAPFIGRIRYSVGNQAPIAVASGSSLSGPAPLTVSFSSAGSSDPEGTALSYAWDFGDGQTSTAANPSHRYATGSYAARLSVSDGSLATLADPLFVTAGNAPTPNVQLPADGALFRGGTVIQYSGSATDIEDGTLPSSRLTWNIDFHHFTHVHPGPVVTGQASGTFTIPVTGHDFHGETWYEFRLTATDSNGLSSSRSHLVFPDKTNLVLDTVPQGLPITLDGVTMTTPLTYDTLIGYHHTLGAPTSTADGVTYTFSKWADGGAQTHGIVVPATSSTYVATFTMTSAARAAAPAMSFAWTAALSAALAALGFIGRRRGRTSDAASKP